MAIVLVSFWILMLCVKIGHTVLVIRWLELHGPTIAKTCGRPETDTEKNVRVFWDAFRAQGASRRSIRLPFGVKDLWLDDAIARSTRSNSYGRLMALWLFRFYWRAWVFVPLSALALVLLAYASFDLDKVTTLLIFIAGLLTLGLMFFIGVEMVVLMVVLGPWLPYFHRLVPRSGLPKENTRSIEVIQLLKVSAGAAIITLVAMAGVICFAALRTDALSTSGASVLSENPFLGVAQAVARSITLIGTAGDGLNTATLYGTALTIVVLPLVLTYIAFLIPTAAGVIDVSRRSK